MAVSIHLATFGLYQVKSDGTIFQRGKDNVTIGEACNLNTQERVTQNNNKPNTTGYPTLEEYLNREAADGYQVKIINQSYVVTEKVT
jgi:uncharacterized protein YmfQ (DUF2313 family)